LHLIAHFTKIETNSGAWGAAVISFGGRMLPGISTNLEEEKVEGKAGVLKHLNSSNPPKGVFQIP
jgi:hypothetical protein